jgi:hypothetical protein
VSVNIRQNLYHIILASFFVLFQGLERKVTSDDMGNVPKIGRKFAKYCHYVLISKGREAGKRGSQEAGKHGGGEARKHGSWEAWKLGSSEAGKLEIH